MQNTRTDVRRNGCEDTSMQLRNNAAIRKLGDGAMWTPTEDRSKDGASAAPGTVRGVLSNFANQLLSGHSHIENKMKVYEVRLDTNKYQRFLPEDQGVWKTKYLKMDCSRKLPDWVPLPIYVPNPRLKKGNFFHLCPGAFVTENGTTEKLRDILEMAGELLPLSCKGADYTLLNVTECMDCLDHDKTAWVFGKATGAKIDIKRYVFKPERLPESSLFKIPERVAHLFVAEGRFDSEDEFKSRVEQEGLEGLLFAEVWRSEI
jgi:hypothetical protein